MITTLSELRRLDKFYLLEPNEETPLTAITYQVTFHESTGFTTCVINSPENMKQYSVRFISSLVVYRLE